ncbi:turripeptide Pal9.2-like [Sitodiplosis mosellana]|uniref:turripeptide Pal9.2-like n=1 Tax=Sitodiplosis mosellana TaxID=263140 RepID=UPI00244520FB|nr:turripeptide Pal9.2-like [Sitodiplosis mosellana]
MRVILLSIVVLLLISTISTAPGVTSTNKQTCSKECTLDYKPICAGHSPTDKEKKSFGNFCVMEKYNCEKDENLVQLSEGECPGSKSVRLQ